MSNDPPELYRVSKNAQADFAFGQKVHLERNMKLLVYTSPEYGNSLQGTPVLLDSYDVTVKPERLVFDKV